MKKINSIGYGGKLLGFGILFAVVIPGVSKIGMLFYQSDILTACCKISFGVGIFLFLFVTGMLAIEFHQDKKMNLKYVTEKNKKLCLGKGIYECQSCGSRSVKATDEACRVCGAVFHNESE